MAIDHYIRPQQKMIIEKEKTAEEKEYEEREYQARMSYINYGV